MCSYCSAALSHCKSMFKVLKFKPSSLFKLYGNVRKNYTTDRLQTQSLYFGKRLELDETENKDVFRGIEFDEVVPKYRNVEQLKNAIEQVKKIYTWKFQTINDKIRNVFWKHYDELKRFDGDEDSPEIKILQLTIMVRFLKRSLKQLEEERQFRILNARRERVVFLAQLRNTLLFDLRCSDFDRYSKIMKELDLTFTLPPSSPPLKLTIRAKEIADMKIRAFAEVKRNKESQEFRKQELEDLEKKFYNEIKNEENNETSNN